MIEYNEEETAELASDTCLGVKVIGVGGSGANVLDRMALEGSDDAELLTLNTDVRALSTSVSSEKIQLGATLLKGMGTGGDPELGKQAALEAVDEIRAAVKGNQMVFVCVGLGGGTGSGAAPEVCRIAKEEGVFLVVFATLPFTFEGQRRTVQAMEALDVIGKYANAVITFDNDRMGELIVPKDGVTQAFAAADKIISQSIRATMNVVFRPGIIRIGMDDLLSALHSKKSRCLFGYGQAKGENRSLEAIDQALKCPLLDRGKLLNDARSLLVQVSGGETMTLYEVQLVMEEVSKHVGASTQVLFGTGTDKRLGNSLAVTIISSIGGEENAAGGEEVEIAQAQTASTSSSAGDQMPSSPLAAAVSAAESGQLIQPSFEAPPEKPKAVYEPINPGPAPVTPIQPSAPAQQTPENPSGDAPLGKSEEEQTPDREPIVPESSAFDAAGSEAAEVPGPVLEAPPASERRSPVEVVPAKKSIVDAPLENASAMSPFDSEEDSEQSYHEDSNPIAKAVQEASNPAFRGNAAQELSDANDGDLGPAPVVPALEQGPVPPRAEDDSVAQREPVKMTPFIPEHDSESRPEQATGPAAAGSGVDRVEATTDSAQTITLSRIVSTGNTGRIQTRDPGEMPPSGPIAPNMPPPQSNPPQESPIPGIGGPSKEAQQQQEMLQLEPVSSGKGRFAKTDPTIVDGEDLDVPTFLRKKK